MGSSHSCSSFRGGFIGSGCNPETGHTDPPQAPAKPPPVKPFTQTQTALGLQRSQKGIFNTASMGASNAQAAMGHY
jgi:hypothetical protein